MLRAVEFYRSQGVHVPPGYNKFLVGHLPILRKVAARSELLKGTEKPAMKQNILATLDELTESKAEDSYDFTKNTVTFLNLALPLLVIQDPEIV